MFKRFLALLLSFLMIFNALPMQTLAGTIESNAMYELKLEEELRVAVDETEYPNGMFDFLATRMNTSENLSSVEFAIVRKGGTAGKASITLKTIDVTAKYGEDYTITIPNGIFSKTLPENKDAITLMDSISSGNKVLTNENVLTEEEIKAVNLNESEIKNAEQPPSVIESDQIEGESLTQAQSILEEEPKQIGLKEQREAFFGVKSDRKTWREIEKEEKEAAVDLHKEMYEDIPGVSYTLEFDEGEYIKKIRFNTIDDKISEDEEQVIFAIVEPVGAATGDSLSAFMNIEDNEEKENVEFEIAEKVIFIDENTDYAEVTVKRTKGLYRYGFISVGTAALTAQPEVDYDPIMTELRFVPGQETQKVRVPIIDKNNKEGLQFIIKLEDDSPNLSVEGNHKALVTIGSQNSLVTTRTGKMNFTKLLSNPGQKMKTLTFSDITGGDFENINNGGWAYLGLNSIGQSKQLYIGGPFTMVERMEIDWSNTAGATKEWYWGWINAVYHDTFYSFFRFGENPNIVKQGNFPSQWTSYTLTDNDRKASYIVAGTYVTGKTKYSELNVGNVKLYYLPINILLYDLPDDEDRTLTPQIWTSETTKQAGSPMDVGKLQFANDITNKEKKFYEGETAYFAPEWNNGIDSSKVYLWGYKIERKGGLEGDPYYYVKGDSLNVKDLITSSLRDKKGRTIPWSEVGLANNTVVILPVFKSRTAFVNINFDPVKGGMAQNSFSNNLTMKIGMLDTVKFNASENTGYFVTGYEHGDANYLYKAVTTDEHERNLESLDATYGNSQITNNKLNYRPINGITINKAVPNELDFKPQKTFSYLSVQYMTPSMKIKVNPRTGSKDKGSILYIPKEGTPQMGNMDTSLIISPIERNKVYTISGVPNNDYSIKWQDFSGDVNEDGIIDKNETNNIAPYKSLFMRNAVSGNYFGYNVRYGNPLIYYSFWPKATGGAPGLISGSVSLLGGNILDNTNLAGAKSDKKPLVGVTVNINGHDVSTDSNGEFSIEHSDFKAGEYYSLTFNYKGINYTGHLNSDVFTEIEVEEYDAFIPYNFSIFEGNSKLEDPMDIYNKDTIYRFRFDVKSLQPGLSANKALVRIYSKEGAQKGTPIEVVPTSGSFTFDFNPSSNNVVPGDTMTIQLVDQNDLPHLEHNVGFSFFKYLNTFSLLTSFKSPVNSAIDLVGALDVAFDLGLSGKVENYIDKKKVPGEWIIAFGFDKSWEKSLYDSSTVEDEDKPAKEELKDAAKSADDTKTNETVDKAVETNKKEKTSASLTADMEFGLSTSLYLRMIVDETKSAYFKEMILSATVSGKFGTKVEIQTPIGVTVYAGFELGGDITGMMVIEQYHNKKFYFDADGQIDFSKAGTTDPKRDFTIYGKFIIRPYILITVGARVPMIDISIDGKAQFSMNFTTTGSGSGKVTLNSVLALKVLVFEFSWEVANKTWDLFNYGHASSFQLKGLFASNDYLYIDADNYEVSSREYLENRGDWKGGTSRRMLLKALGNNAYNEQTLQTGVYPYPYTLLAPIGDDKQLLTFLDDDTSMDDLNRTQLYYSTYSGITWSAPIKVDDDSTPDDTPWIYDMGEEVLVAWSSAVNEVSTSDSAIQVLNNRGLKARFFDKETKTFGDVIKITDRSGSDNFSDSDPSIAYWKDNTNKEHLFITYTKTQYESPTNSDKDALIGDILNAYSTFNYSFYDFTNNIFAEEGFLDVREYAKVDESEILIDEEEPDMNSSDFAWNGYWSEAPTLSAISVSAIAADPLVVDSNAIAYDDYAIIAYSIDRDTKLETTNDRMLFIKPYQFSNNTFYPAIYFDDVDEHIDLEFVQANDNVYLFFASKGDVVSIDIGNLLNNNVLHYNVGGEDVLVLNKTKEIYKKPEIVVKHKYETTKDQSGNEIVTNESPINELMVKANNDNIYVMWSEKDITYKEGIDPNSAEAGNPENYYHENHIYAARQIISPIKEIQLYDENGNELKYPEKDENNNVIDYSTKPDYNFEVGKVKAGDPIKVKHRDTEWSEPVKLTNEQGANFNDIDFEILSNGNLRAVFVKGKSEVMEVAGQEMSVENVNSRTLMTADFNVSVNNIEATMSDIPMVKPNELVYFDLTLKNKALNTLENLKVELYEVLDGVEDIVSTTTAIKLRGGEEKTIPLLYQAPNLMDDAKILVKVKQIDGSNEYLINSVEQNLKLNSSIDVLEAKAEFVTRDKVKVSGSAENKGNINAKDAVVYANVLGKIVGSLNIGTLEVGEQKVFEFFTDITSDMFEANKNEDGSINELMKLNIYSSGNGLSLNIERYGSKKDLDVVNNINSFRISTEDYNISDSINIENGSTINIKPDLTYTNNDLVKPRVVYASNNESVASIYNDSAITAKKDGTATITAYAIPENNKMILSKDGIEYADNLLTLPKEAIRLKSFNVNVYSYSNDSSDDTVVVTTPDTVPTVNANTQVNQSGEVVASVSLGQINNIVKQALDKKGDNAGSSKIEIKVTEGKEKIETKIPSAAFKEISDKKIEMMTLDTPIAKISLDQKTIAGVANKAQEDISIKASKVLPSELSDETQKIVGDRPIFDFKITSGDKAISEFDGYVEVSVDYKPVANEDADSVVIYYIEDNDSPKIVSNSKFDEKTGSIIFKTNHFSKFAVGYNKVLFSDVEKDKWYNKAIGFIAARNITTGTSKGIFSPETNLTRAQFLVMMMRAYGINVGDTLADNFQDAGNTYYTDYLSTAKKLGISKGTGNNLFEPEKQITRQEMFVMLYNALSLIEQLPEGSEGKMLSDFSDENLVATWAKESMQAFTKAKVVEGSENKLNPQANATRAEMAQLIYNLLKR